MTKDEALKLALEALDSCGDDYWNTDDDYGTVQVFDEDKVHKALAAIKEALQPKPPKRPWRPSTEKEKARFLLPFGSYGEMEAIEALLKEHHGV